jgi:uncharacterized membrane protein
MIARHLSTGRLVELVLAVLILAAGIFLYRRRDRSDSYGSQGAVILFVVALIMAIHALGGLDYHPSAAEAEYFRSGGH